MLHVEYANVLFSWEEDKGYHWCKKSYFSLHFVVQ